MKRIHLDINRDDSTIKHWLKTRWNRIAKFSPTWSLLSIYGNTPLAKLTIISPIVAQAVYHSGTWIEKNIGLSNLIWLYWSLLAIGLAQLIYTFRCPREIKKYGINTELHKIESLTTKSDSTFSVLYNNFIASHFGNLSWVASPENLRYSGPFTLKPSSEDEITNLLDEARLKKDKHAYWTGLSKILYENKNEKVVKVYSEFKKLAESGIYTGFDTESWRIIHALFELHPELCNVDKPGCHWMKLPLYERCYELNDAWKLRILDWAYSFHDIDRAYTRWTVLSLYICGSMYFLYSVVTNIIKMFMHTFSIATM